MNTKKLSVFFFALASILLVTSLISAAVSRGNGSEIVVIDMVKVNDVEALGNNVAVEAGETISVKVLFTALKDASDVRLRLGLEGDKVDVESTTGLFTIEQGKTYSKTLTLQVPSELQDEVSSDLTLAIKIWNGDFKTEDDSRVLRVQRPSYGASVMSIDSASSVSAGQLYPVDIVLKNTGYNNLDDVYVTLRIADLGIERKSYFGDLVSIETKYDADTTVKRFFLEVPFNAKAGSYTLEVEASNADFAASATKEISIVSEFSGSTVIVNSMTKAASVGKDAEFEMILINPTNKLRVYRVVTESTGDLTTSSSAQLVAVPAGMTKSVIISAKPESKGEYDFDVSVFAGEEVVDSVTLKVLADGRGSSSSAGSVVALTIILAIIFLVLLGALYALLRKKPEEQTEDFGESYY